MPRVSILLTCYNHLEHLKVALDCIKAQTFTDYEVVALDDGSTDGTREWLTQVQADFPTMSLHFNEQNLGTYGTLNKGIAVSAGELIAVFNDDDVWLPTKLERQVAMMDAHPEIGLVHTGGYFIDGEGREIKDNPLGFPWPKTGTGDVLRELVDYNKVIASSVIVRRECFETVGLFNDKLFGSGDWEMWCRIAERYHVGHIDELLTLYRIHAGSASHFSEKILKDDHEVRLGLVERIPGYFSHGWSAKTIREVLAHQYACIGTSYVALGEAKKGRQMYWRSLSAMPLRFKSLARIVASYLPKKAFRALR